MKPVHALTLTVCLSGPAAALAHGNPPGGGLVVLQPGDPHRMWLRSTFGNIVSDEAFLVCLLPFVRPRL